jgi:hypothetical protein
MLLNELTWHTTSSYNDVIDGIPTDPVPPARIIPGDCLQCRGRLSQQEMPLTVTIIPFDGFAKGDAVRLKVLESPLVPRINIAATATRQGACSAVGKAVKDVIAPSSQPVFHNRYPKCIPITPATVLGILRCHGYGGLRLVLHECIPQVVH